MNTHRFTALRLTILITLLTATFVQNTPVFAINSTLQEGISGNITTRTKLPIPIQEQLTEQDDQGSWTLTGSLNIARVGHTATLLNDGKVLVVGGRDADLNTLSSVELYDPHTKNWSFTGSLNTPRSDHTATLLTNGKVLIAGGRGYVDGFVSAELYDPTTGTWSPTGSLSTGRYHHTSALLADGRVLVAVGYNAELMFLTSTEIYDPTAGLWTPTGKLNYMYSNTFMSSLPNGQVLIMGGTNQDIENGFVAAELYDPSTGTWIPTGFLGVARQNHDATLLPNGKVLVAGGTPSGSLYRIASSELYDPNSGSWSYTGSLNVGREYHTITLLPNGKVLAAGGWGGILRMIGPAELYDPTTHTWSITAPMNIPRMGHTATLLPNGKVLIVGGSSGGPLSATELYDPNGSEINPDIKFSVTTSGHFIYSDPSNHASIPFTVHVADSSGMPVLDAAISIYGTFLGNTNGNGNLDTWLPISSTPINGDFVAEVIARINGQDYSSGPLILYSSVLRKEKQFTVTDAQAKIHTQKLLQGFAARPGLSDICPDSKDLLGVGCVIVSNFFMFVKISILNKFYYPMPGDINAMEIYEYSAPNVTPVYLYSESALRDGNYIYRRSSWTENYLKAERYIVPEEIDRTTLAAELSSPATLLIVDPQGKRAGFDPLSGTFTFDFPVAISDKGEEPYFLIVPSPSTGQYKLLVTGTGDGQYGLKVWALNSSGEAETAVEIQGTATLGVTDTYLLTYTPGQPVETQRQVQIDIKPSETPNPINIGSRGLLPVAILSTPTFDAITVVPTSVQFGPKSIKIVKSLTFDVNLDGLLDLVLYYDNTLTGIKAGDTQACLAGKNTGGLAVSGCDSIVAVPPKK